MIAFARNKKTILKKMSDAKKDALLRIEAQKLPCTICLQQHPYGHYIFCVEDEEIDYFTTTNCTTRRCSEVKAPSTFCTQCASKMPQSSTRVIKYYEFDKTLFEKRVNEFMLKLKSNEDFIWEQDWCTHANTEEECKRCAFDGWPTVHFASQLDNAEECATNLLSLTLNTGQWPAAEPEMFPICDFFRHKRFGKDVSDYNEDEMRRIFTRIVQKHISELKTTE